jgi:hypothetical protein
LCLPLMSSWLTVEGGRQISAARVLHRRGGWAAVAVSVGVAGGVPDAETLRPSVAALEASVFGRKEAPVARRVSAETRGCIRGIAVVPPRRR